MQRIIKSVVPVGLGVLLSLLLALLIVFGILAPLLTVFMGAGRFGLEIGGPTSVATVLMIASAAFSFYWGGMLASYKAPGRRRLHGTLVAPAAFLVSPIINVLSGNGFFPGLDTSRAVLFMLAVLAVSTVGAYVGARGGVSLYEHNKRYARRKKKPRQRRRSPERG